MIIEIDKAKPNVPFADLIGLFTNHFLDLRHHVDMVVVLTDLHLHVSLLFTLEFDVNCNQLAVSIFVFLKLLAERYKVHGKLLLLGILLDFLLVLRPDLFKSLEAEV